MSRFQLAGITKHVEIAESRAEIVPFTRFAQQLGI